MFKFNHRGLTYVYLYILIFTIGVLLYHLPSINNSSYVIDEYEYLLLKNHNPRYFSDNLNNFEDRWQTNKVSNYINNPEKHSYAIIKLKLDKSKTHSNSLYIKTSNNNFDIYKKDTYIKSSTPIQGENYEHYITAPFSNTYVINEINDQDFVYLYMETNMPQYAGYIADAQIIQSENLSKIFSQYFIKFLIFVVCFMYSIYFTLYIFISDDYSENKILKKIILAMTLFTIFLITDSSIIFSYFPLKEWTKINTVALWLTSFYGIYAISSIITNDTLNKVVKGIALSYIPFLLFIWCLDYARIAYYNVTYNYLILYIILSLIALLMIFMQIKNKKHVIKHTMIVICIFILVFTIEFIKNTYAINYFFDDILNSFILIFAFFTFILLKGYIDKSIQMQEILDLVLQKRFEVNSIIKCINKTISSDYDINEFCLHIENSVKLISSNPQDLELSIFKVDKKHNIFEILYTSTDFQFFRREIEDHIESTLLGKHNTYVTSNRRRIYFSVKQNDSTILISLGCKPYFNHKDLSHLTLYLQSIKKSLQNILIYTSSMNNQETVLEEVVKIINKHENNKFNALAIGDLCYYIATKLGLGYTKAMHCKIVSYAINIGKLNLNKELLEKEVLGIENFKAYFSYLDITHDMVKNFDNNIMQLTATVTSQYFDKYDGSGTNGLKGEEIDINTRIIRVAINMVYYYLNQNIKSHKSFTSSLQLIKIQENSIFDPNIIQVLENNKKEIKSILNKYLKEDY